MYDKFGCLTTVRVTTHTHTHTHTHSHSHTHSQCAVTEHVLAHEFTELSEEMMLTDIDGEICHVEEEEEGHGDSINSNSACY